ncbi:MAG: hypothetical protein AB8G23_21205 [Myxococcota bacterium]
MLSLLLTGCMTPDGPPLSGLGMTDAALAIDDARAGQVIANFRAMQASRNGLRGSARVALSGPDFKLNRPQRIVLKRPANLRFEVVGLFDQLAAILATDGEEFGFYEAGQPEIARGRVTPGLLWDLAKIDLEPEELVGLLLGAPKPSPGAARAAVWLEPAVAEEEADRIAIAFAWPSEVGPDCAAAEASALCSVPAEAMAMGAEVFVFDASSQLVEMRAVEAGGAIRFRAEFADYKPLAAGSQQMAAGAQPLAAGAQQAAAGAQPADAASFFFPNRVTIGSPQLASEARFVWKRVMLSEELSDQHFRLPEPTGRVGNARSGG